jgi:hypothetical protein
MRIAIAILAVLLITALGVFAGWAMDQSLFPPSGGGWRCYRDCIAIVWLPPLAGLALWSLPAFCRWLTRTLAS